MRVLARSFLLALLLVTASATSVVFVASAAAGRRHRAWQCRPRHPHLVVANTRAEVFQVGYTEPARLGAPAEFDPEWLVGCAYGSKHAYWLEPEGHGSSSGVGGSGLYTLAGTTVAFTGQFSKSPGVGVEVELSWLRVVNLRSGRTLHNVPTGTLPCEHPPQFSGVGSVASLVLKEDGAIAWIVSDHESLCPVPAGTREVHALDSTGERVLAIGTNIAPHSLALAGSTVHWTQGGKRASAPLN
jgi:hypothetical protein